MMNAKSFKSILASFAVCGMIMAVTEFVALLVPAQAFALAAPAKKAFAVFVVSFNPKTRQAIGGVAGTAFFVSPRKAITAYHVLQAKSFVPQAGFTQARVWLVHEDEPAIELKSSNVAFQADSDLTSIDLKMAQVPEHLVYSTETSIAPNGPVQTEGFKVNTAGPELAWEGDEIRITSVPHLDRIFFEGRLLQKAKVDLQANDVKLNNVPCLQLSYQPVRGLSGGPVLVNGKVVGMNSFADPTVSTPQDSLEKAGHAGGSGLTWAVELKSRP